MFKKSGCENLATCAAAAAPHVRRTRGTSSKIAASSSGSA
jgi:hypothetical protein